MVYQTIEWGSMNVKPTDLSGSQAYRTLKVSSTPHPNTLATTNLLQIVKPIALHVTRFHRLNTLREMEIFRKDVSSNPNPAYPNTYFTYVCALTSTFVFSFSVIEYVVRARRTPDPTVCNGTSYDELHCQVCIEDII